jgi:crotonobetainyl-CoA:carnitine CoA-transferase CaiB-like acyl-CoA transferase
MLADQGADVLKIENPDLGDPARHLEPKVGNLSIWHKVAGRNKKALTLKLSSKEGADLLKRLVTQTDVLIENFRPGTMEKWGLGWEDLKAVNPKLVMVRISGYGQTGPYANRPGFGTIAEAVAGLPIRNGMPDGPPMLSPFALADTVAGLFGAFSLMFGIFNRDHGTREGQVIDIGLHEPLFRVIEDQVPAYDKGGVVPERMGNRVSWAAPRGVFQANDGKWIALSAVSPRTVARLLTVIGGPELARDERFTTNQSCVKNVDALEGYIKAWVGARTQEEVLAVFEREDVVAGPLYDVERIMSDPHYAHRESILTITDDDFGTMKVPGIVPKFVGTPGKIEHLSAPMGHHNQQVYGERLGLSASEFESLKEKGII